MKAVQQRLVEAINRIPGHKKVTLFSKDSFSQTMELNCDRLDESAGPGFYIFMAKLGAAIDGGGALLIRRHLAEDKAVMYACRFEDQDAYAVDADSLEWFYNTWSATPTEGLAYGDLSDYWPEVRVVPLG
jgi:hypothetical protein